MLLLRVDFGPVVPRFRAVNEREIMHHSRQRAFTLIELLVVIAIIGLLVSILLPSLSRAREMAKSMMCATNLRQLSHGWHLYADDNRDVSVPGRYAKAVGGTSNPENWFKVGNGLKYRPRWIATMGKHVGLFAFNEPRTDNDRQDYDGKVYQCPTVAEWVDERNHAFGYNHQFLGNARKTNGRFHNFPVNRSRIQNFASTVLGGDCLGTAAGLPVRERGAYANDGKDFASRGNHGWTLDPPRLTDESDRGTGDDDSPRTAVDPRHVGRANVVFCDGHAQTSTPENLGYRLFDDGAYVDAEIVKDPPTNKQFSGTGRDDDPPDLPQ
jgi:prepilin-type N-terminal cleavage/methylation domain-containing protein/prepilin-type processing-associated H-X9-DG protein